MIMVCTHNQLGNQLFSYAYGRFLARKHGTELVINTWAHLNTWVKCRLPELQVNCSYCSDDWQDEQGLAAKYPNLKIFRDGSTDELFNAGDNVILIGEWGSTRFLTADDSDMIPLLRREFEIRDNNRSDDYVRLRGQIDRASGAVAVHIRLGDNRRNPDFLFTPPGNDYYERAFERIEKSVDNPEYFVFSDEIDYAEANYQLRTAHPLTFVRTKSDLEDFDLMKRCKHNIIANSTYSWWAACLNENGHKQVIAPLKWYVNPEWQHQYENETVETGQVPPEWAKI